MKTRKHLNELITVGFKYKGHKVFGDFGQMSLVPGCTFFSILLDLNHRKLTKNIFILYLNMRQASCMLVYDLISWFSRLETVVAIENFSDKNTKKRNGVVCLEFTLDIYRNKFNA